jgi:DNA-binding transcriptional ArsR family regulator
MVYLFYMATMTIFAALAEPLRRQILDLIRDQPRNVGELADLLQITQPNVSKHLIVLRDVGLVRVRQEKQRRWYELNPAPLAEVVDWLAPYRQYVEARYDRLEELLDEIENEETEHDEQA